MATKSEDIAQTIATALDCADSEYGGGYTPEEIEINGNVLIIRPKDLKRAFRVTIEMVYE